MPQYLSLILLMTLGFIFLYYRTFSTFAIYDDDGSALSMFTSILKGIPLYDETLSVYGAFWNYSYYYLHMCFDLAPSHYSIRIFFIAFSILISTLCFLFAYQLTKSKLIGSIAICISLLRMNRLAYEPGLTPILICFILSILIFCLYQYKHEFKNNIYIFISGVCCALLFHIKINIGVFVFASVATYFFLCLPIQGALKKYSNGLGIAITFTLPLVLMHQNLSDSIIQEIVIHYYISSIGLLTAIIITTYERNFKTNFNSLKEISIYWILGCATAVLFVFGLLLFHNTSFAGIYEGYWAQHLKFALVHYESMHFPWWQKIIFIVSLYWLGTFIYLKKKNEQYNFLIVIKLFFLAITILTLLYRFTESARLIYASLPLLWIVALPLKNKKNESRWLATIAICLFSLFLHLMNYPVFGSNITVATFPIIALVFYLIQELKEANLTYDRLLIIFKDHTLIIWLVPITCASILSGSSKLILFNALLILLLITLKNNLSKHLALFFSFYQIIFLASLANALASLIFTIPLSILISAFFLLKQNKSGKAIIPSLCFLSILSLSLQTKQVYQTFQNMIPFDLNRTGPLRSDEQTVLAYQWLSKNLKQNSETFVSYPGASLHFFSDIQPATQHYITDWANYLSAERQEKMLQVFSKSYNHAFIENPATNRFFGHLKGRPELLLNYFKQHYEKVAEYHHNEFFIDRRRTQPLTWSNCAWSDYHQGSARIRGNIVEENHTPFNLELHSEIGIEASIKYHQMTITSSETATEFLFTRPNLKNDIFKIQLMNDDGKIIKRIPFIKIYRNFKQTKTI